MSGRHHRPARLVNRFRPRLEALEGREVPATLPAGFTETNVATGLIRATAMEIAPDDTIYVAQQDGDLRVVKNGVLQEAPVLTVDVSAQGERGLLGVTVDPGFAQNRSIYVYYTTATSPVHNRVSRFTLNAAGDQVVAGSELALMDLEPLGATNHNGGALHFGRDGKLYVATGDNAVSLNSQTRDNRLGKILRINADGSIPTDNPFFNTATGDNRAIWALGLRNPFTFAVQPGIGRIYINDVGAATWEEINEGARGANYGWPTTEGPTTDPRFRTPLYAYTHGGGPDQGFAITGGTFYNPATNQFPAEYVGDYFFADLVNGWIRRYDPATRTVTGFATGLDQPVDLRTGPEGSLYYLSRGAGTLVRVRTTPTDLNFSTSWVNVPRSAATNTAFRVNRSYNIGPGRSPTGFLVRYFASLDATFANRDDLLVGTEFVSAAADLTPGKHTKLTPFLRVGRPGRHYLFVFLDTSGRVAETSETNNITRSSIQFPVSGKVNVVVDNFDPGYSEDFGARHAYGTGFGGQVSFLNPGVDARRARWQVQNLPAGTYEVRVTWPAQPGGAATAPYRVFDDGAWRATRTFDQRRAPVGTTLGGIPFQTIARVTITSGTLLVMLFNDAPAYVTADAVWIVQV